MIFQKADGWYGYDNFVPTSLYYLYGIICEEVYVDEQKSSVIVDTGKVKSGISVITVAYDSGVDVERGYNARIYSAVDNKPVYNGDTYGVPFFNDDGLISSELVFDMVETEWGPEYQMIENISVYDIVNGELTIVDEYRSMPYDE